MLMKEIYKQVAEKLNLSKETVTNIYKMYCSFIKNKIITTNINTNEDVGFNFTRIGTIYLNKNKIKKNEIKHQEN